MATTRIRIAHPHLGESAAAKKSRASTWIALALVLVLLLAAGYVISTRVASVDGPAAESMTRQEILQKLVNEGLIPRQSLEPAPLSREEILQKLVNEGLIPRQSLEPAPLSREDIVRDLVNRGLIPRQTLDGE